MIGAKTFPTKAVPRDWMANSPTRSAMEIGMMYGAKPWVMLCAMVRGVRKTTLEFEEAAALRRELPITALSAETREAILPPALAGWFQLQGTLEALRSSHRNLARSSANGVWRIVPGSDHLIASSQPQAVVDAVLDMMVRLKPDTRNLSASGRRAGH